MMLPALPQYDMARILRINGDAISEGAGKCRSGTAARLDTPAAEQTGALPQATPEEGRIGVSPVESMEGGKRG